MHWTENNLSREKTFKNYLTNLCRNKQTMRKLSWKWPKKCITFPKLQQHSLSMMALYPFCVSVISLVLPLHQDFWKWCAIIWHSRWRAHCQRKKNCFVGTVAKKSLSNIAAWDVFGDFTIYGILIFLGLVLFDCLLLFVCFFLLRDHIVHWHRLPRVSSLEISRSCLDTGLGPSSGWPCWWSRDWSRGTQRALPQ